jgi:hypothetical protein
MIGKLPEVVLRTSGSMQGKLVAKTSGELELRLRRANELKQRAEEEGRESGINLPSMEIARTFAVETIDYPNPLGLQ